jgi:hypothetical protein
MERAGEAPMRKLSIVVACGCALLGALATGGSAAAAVGPVWRIDALANTTAAPGGTSNYLVQLTNNGDSGVDATQTPVQLTASLPAGVSASGVTPYGDFATRDWDCSATTFGVPGGTVSCVNTSDLFAAGSGYAALQIQTTVAADAPSPAVAGFTVDDGADPAASTVSTVRVTAAAPGFGLAGFDAQLPADAAGAPSTQAGGRPFAVTTLFGFNSVHNATLSEPLVQDYYPAAPVKDIVADLPPGLIGNPVGIAQCTAGDLAHSVAGFQANPLCSPASQLGTVRVLFNGLPASPNIVGPLPIFNIVAPPGVPARFGFNVQGIPITLDAKVRSGGDYGLSVVTPNISEALGIVGTDVTFWGTPADPAHDYLRWCPSTADPDQLGHPGCAAGVTPRAFLRNPTSCSRGGLSMTASVDSWDQPGAFDSVTGSMNHEAPGFPYPASQFGAPVPLTGCEKLPFDPVMDVVASSHEAGSSTGLDVHIHMPQSDDPATLAQADVRKVVTTLPAGVTANPAAASGLTGCTPAQFAPGTAKLPDCPASSKIGTVAIDSPDLPDKLEGSIYQAAPGDNPFHSLLALYAVASADGVVIKLPGRIDADPQTGQLTTTFDDNPQLPFSDYTLHFNQGPHAALVTPRACGTYETKQVLEGWNGESVEQTSSFTIDSGPGGSACPDPSQFAPRFRAGVQNPVGGASSPFVLQVTRTDSDQELETISTQLPPGLLASIRGVPRCGDADAAAGTCPAASQIGHVTVGAGAGSDPFYLDGGRVFLTDGYKGAPFGLDIAVPALAGPFDLGLVNVRAALAIDPVTAQASVAADPMPRILQGIPVLARDVRVVIDRPGFMLNPTSCAEKRIAGTIGSYGGQTAQVASRFQVADCQALALTPKLAISLSGRGQARPGKHPALDATVTQPSGQANLRQVVTKLPLSLALDPNNAQGLCEYQDGLANKCGPQTIVGRATALTPILNQPLSGPVYFVKGVRTDAQGVQHKTLPTLLIPLKGENGVEIDLRAQSATTKSNQLVTTFSNIPDAPISRFALHISGGRHGILVVSGGQKASICAKRQQALALIDGQNGKTADQRVAIRTASCARHRRKRR